MARFAGVAGCAVSILSTFQAPPTDVAAANKSEAFVSIQGKSAEFAAPIQIAPEFGIAPAVSTVSDFVFDTGSKDYISDEALLKSLRSDDDEESASFALEGYVTAGGETLAKLALRYSLDAEALSLLNGKKADEVLAPGTRINLYKGDVTLYTSERGDTFEKIARKFGTDALLLTVCNHLPSSTLSAGQRLFIPQGILEREGDAGADDAPASAVVIGPVPGKAPAKPANTVRKGRFEKVINFAFHTVGWPVHGRLSSPFGWRLHPILNETRFHAGIDISAPSGTPIRAVGPGRVIFAGWRGGMGRCVVLRHANNYATLYAHCSQLDVQTGQSVSAHQVVGLIGSSGLSTGSHLHFAVLRGQTPLNPMKFLR